MLNVRNHFQPFNFNLAISQQQLQLFIKYSKFFRRPIVDICTCKGDFGNSYFLQRAALSELLLALIFVQSTVVFGNSYCQEDLFQVSNFCKDNIIFSKHHFAIVHCLKDCVNLFDKRSSDYPLFSNPTGIFWRIISLSHPCCYVE